MKNSLTPEYLEKFRQQAAEYGYGITDEGFLTRGDKNLDIRLEVKKGRLRFMYGDKLRASCSAKKAGEIGWFLENVLFAQKVK